MPMNSESHIPKKHIFKGTTNVPLRFAILGSHKSSKSSFVSIISNQISLPNYYPTIQNSPILVQFQPKRFSSRAILDVHVTPKNLNEMNLLGNDSIVMDQNLMKRIDLEGLKQAKLKNSNAPIYSNDESSQILNLTNNHYDLDYSVWDMFDNEYFKPVNSFSNQAPAISTIDTSKFKSHRGILPKPMHFNPDRSTHKFKYKPPVSTPILIELIDTPGIQQDDLIPFLERSLDCRLSKDVLNNLANDYNTNFRSRVTPLITGSGISDLNASINGYLLCYSCVPESELSNVPPPIYGEKEDSISNQINSIDNIEVLKSLYFSIFEAWKEWTTYQVNWEIGKEYDSLSLATSIKQIWKKKELPMMEMKDLNELAPEERKRLEKFLERSDIAKRPPIVIACTHIDSPYASPLLIEKGKQIANEWGCSFVQMSCSYDSEDWCNVEEAMALLVREASDIEIKRM